MCVSICMEMTPRFGILMPLAMIANRRIVENVFMSCKSVPSHRVQQCLSVY